MDDPGARSDPAAGGRTAGAADPGDAPGPGDGILTLLGRIARLVDDPDPAAAIARRSLALLRADTGADAAAFLRFDAATASVVAIVADDQGTIDRVVRILEHLPTEAPSVGRTLASDVALELDFEDPAMGPPELVERILEMGFRRLWAIPAASGRGAVPGAVGLLWRRDRSTPPFDPVALGHLGRVVGAVVNSGMLRDAMRAEITRRSELEEAARLAGHVVDQARTAIVVTDIDRRVTAWNPAAERIYGLSAADAVGRPIGDLLVWYRADGSELGPGIRDQVIAGEPFMDRVMQRIVRGPYAGRELLIDPVVTALRDEHGRFLGLVALNRDVTATGRLEAELAELGSLAIATGTARSTQEVAAAALEVLGRATGAEAGLILAPADDGIVAAGARGIGQAIVDRIVAYGRIGERLTAALADPGAILFATVDEAPLRPEVAAAIRAEGIGHVMIVGLRVAGELTGILALGWRSEPVRPGRAAILQAAALVAAALAGTRSLVRAETSERRYRSLFGHLPIACLAIRPDGRVAEANAAAERLFGYPAGGLEDRPVTDLTADAPPADADRGAEGRPSDDRAAWGWGDHGRRANGSRFPIEVTVTEAALGGDVVALAMVRDLSEQHRLQAELTQAQKMEALGQLVSGVAHELNNPLASIIAFSQLIRRDDRLPDDMRGDADLLVQEADRTRRIVQNLLDFARQRPPERHATRLSLLVTSVLELQAYSLSTGRIEVMLDVPDDLPLVEVDRPQIQQVLLNLTLNAIQAIQGDRGTGRISIEARAVDGPGGPRILLAVADDGPGVAEPMRRRIFDPFFTTKPPGQGTGLGLSVSFGIVSAHRGRLWHEPGPDGTGSVFHLELPAAARPKPEPEIVPAGPAMASPAAPATDGRTVERPRVLVLDDEPSIRTFLVKALRVAGLEAVVADDGRSAVELVRTTAIDALLLDHRMAGMSGTDVYLAAVEARPDLAGRAVFMSGDVLNPELRAFASRRGVGLLAKPFDVDAVGRAVREVLPGEPPA